ncbi:Protein kinase superfamily protein [Euphorbia peplus]|nr:Protein kinase superfamily protein [Euphorbia peplus]
MDSRNVISEASSSQPLHEYKLEDLVISSHIGDGRFARVYEGIDRKFDRTVAIKKLQRTDPMKGFVAESEILKNHQHDNLVKIYGYCIEDKEDLIIVLELIPNRTLQFHLHARGEEVLAWSNRFKIAVGSAKGIAYLHGAAVIHRDIKPANILLLADFTPKIADFGLSRLIPTDKAHISTTTYGTPAYVAPECDDFDATIHGHSEMNHFTEKSDVYSFGIVLVELITGKPRVGRNLLKQVHSLCNDGGVLKDIVDVNLQGQHYIDQMKRMIYCAAASTCEDPADRPTMREIIKVLEGDMGRKALSYFSESA